jgi:hypothetical protein
VRRLGVTVKERKNFFFEKKKQKTFVCCPPPLNPSGWFGAARNR